MLVVQTACVPSSSQLRTHVVFLSTWLSICGRSVNWMLDAMLDGALASGPAQMRSAQSIG